MPCNNHFKKKRDYKLYQWNPREKFWAPIWKVRIKTKLLTEIFVTRLYKVVVFSHNDDCLLRLPFSTLRPRHDGHYFANDIFKCSFLSENVRISIKIPLKFVPKRRINNILALVQIMAWRQSDDKPLSKPMMKSLLTHMCVCVSRP